MPGLKVVPWAFAMDGSKVKRVRVSPSREGLVTFMANRLPGETTLSHLKAELPLSDNQLSKLKEALRDKDHPTTTALAALGVSYVVRGRGRGAKLSL